ncbi:MAG: hypothetical protein IT340_19855 [Chloroflexi bacterium]|nr:hypothetical protein [Chloroflexota bacterium]
MLYLALIDNDGNIHTAGLHRTRDQAAKAARRFCRAEGLALSFEPWGHDTDSSTCVAGSDDSNIRLYVLPLAPPTGEKL